jgi:hypothetical protein
MTTLTAKAQTWYVVVVDESNRSAPLVPGYGKWWMCLLTQEAHTHVSFFSHSHSQFFKRVKKAHTWEVPPLDSKEQEMIENIDEDKMRQKLAETLLRNKESQYQSKTCRA